MGFLLVVVEVRTRFELGVRDEDVGQGVRELLLGVLDRRCEAVTGGHGEHLRRSPGRLAVVVAVHVEDVGDLDRFPAVTLGSDHDGQGVTGA